MPAQQVEDQWGCLWSMAIIFFINFVGMMLYSKLNKIIDLLQQLASQGAG